jgi:ABC-type antimicrobial peptide transport system permease subunit
MQVVDGEKVPSGQRGMLLSKYIYEDQFKLKTARRLDKIKEAITESGKKIADDPDLQLMVKQNKTQTREFMLQLDPQSAQTARTALQKVLSSKTQELSKLLSELFDTNDQNFLERYEIFYKEIAPLVQLYRLKPGDSMTIKAFTKSGFLLSANVKIYGTFQFKGLEKSGLAGGISLMDIMTFRDLYGFVTPEKLEESNKLKAQTGVTFVERDNAESELFGGASVVSSGAQKPIDDEREMGGVKYDATAQSLLNRVYTADEIEKGLILNAAVILRDPSKLDLTMKEINEVSKKKNLDLRVVTWQTAAGNIGQFVFVAKFALYFAVFIIFIVALVIINNAVMMATLQRIREIGTMRAIGAQRSFVLGLVLIETIILGLSFGTVGTLLGAGVVKWLGIKGIPAGNEFLYFFFSGPRLYVGLGLGSLIAAFVTICVVTCISSLYPAVVATRVSPLQAMQTED